MTCTTTTTTTTTITLVDCTFKPGMVSASVFPSPWIVVPFKLVKPPKSYREDYYERHPTRSFHPPPTHSCPENRLPCFSNRNGKRCWSYHRHGVSKSVVVVMMVMMIVRLDWDYAPYRNDIKSDKHLVTFIWRPCPPIIQKRHRIDPIYRQRNEVGVTTIVADSIYKSVVVVCT